MASITENEQEWGGANRWPQEGDEWSECWGSAQAQWSGCLLPRIFPFLGGRILEIAPGHGRWTQFLQAHCSSLIGIDLAQACVDRCRERFRESPHLEFDVNDGLTFPMIEGGSIDFAFSFDSLVHAESDVMLSYVNELVRVLKPGGVAFLHHSNFDAVFRGSPFLQVKKIIKRLLRLPYSTPHWRAPSASAKKIREFVQGAGMSCLQQEIVPWGTGRQWMIDCMSTIVNARGTPCHVVKNPRFMKEAAAIRRIASLREAGAQEAGAGVSVNSAS
jgi:SAM-dependent methyltransferase